MAQRACSSRKVDSWKTAVKRPIRVRDWPPASRPSKDLPRWIRHPESYGEDPRILDYGCGYGQDASHYGWEKYDPHFFPKMPRGKFDVIFCSYVLNTIPLNEVNGVLDDIEKRMRRGGCAFITVRRDNHEKFGEVSPGKYVTSIYNKSRNTVQTYVELDLPVYRYVRDYVTYVIDRSQPEFMEGYTRRLKPPCPPRT
jgi:SAM-dependent methyltransferase